MEKLNIDQKNLISAGFNKSMAFVGALGLNMVNSMVTNIFETITNNIRANNQSPLFGHDINPYIASTSRFGSRLDKAAINFW